MADTIRELIIQDLVTQLETLSGYGGVRRDPETIIRDSIVPCIMVLPGMETAERRYGEQHIIMPVSIYSLQVLGDYTSGELAEIVLGDLISTVIGGRDSIGRIDDLRYTSGGVEGWPDKMEQALSVQIDIEVQYSTHIGDPYTQTNL